MFSYAWKNLNDNSDEHLDNYHSKCLKVSNKLYNNKICVFKDIINIVKYVWVLLPLFRALE